MGRMKSRRQPRIKPQRQPYRPPDRGALADGMPTLYEQRPAGQHYQDWVNTSGVELTTWLEQLRQRTTVYPGLAEDGPDMADNIEFYTPIYGAHIPYGAAMALDAQIEAGAVAYRLAPEEEPAVMPLDHLVGVFEQDGVDPGKIRESIHALHAAGLLLMGDDGILCANVPAYAAPWVPAPAQYRLIESAVPSGTARH